MLKHCVYLVKHFLSIFATFDFPLLFKLAIVINSSLLVLLVFRDEIVHVGFSFSELHFVHTFTSVPMQESLSPEHSSELFRNALEQFLDSGGVSNKCGSHLETTRRNITHSGLYVIGDPFNEEGRILEDEDEEVETGDETGDESSDEKKEEGANDKKDEEEPSNLQLAWEMLELAKIVYTKLVTDAKDDEKLVLLEKLCCALCALGEVSIESENYKQAIEDFQACLKNQAEFPKDSRCIAETHYQLGVALGYDAQFDEAVTSLKSAISIIQERITLKEKEESEEAKKEVTELKALVPEIEEKIKDTEDSKKEAENKKTTETASSSSGDALGSEKTTEVKPVSSIAVKRSAEEEDSSSKKLASEKETAAAS